VAAKLKARNIAKSPLEKKHRKGFGKMKKYIRGHAHALFFLENSHKLKD
jgi:hypothetical protein